MIDPRSDEANAGLRSTGTATPAVDVGAVAIGRNEGQRLIDCLGSLIGRVGHVVYVDSGSTDGSVEAATRLGALVVTLPAGEPFTAARARNAGWRRLLELDPALRYVQFVDGDCLVVDGWIEEARAALEADPALAVVCGRRRERFPEASLYNRLVDLEWDTPVGPAAACGGDAMMRAEALRQVGGFDPSLIAGEEPDLCFRLRAEGRTIERLDAEMTRHDAAMDRFGQWWRRNVRAGHACAEGAARHGRSPERYNVRQSRSNWFWGLVVPSLAVGLAWPTRGLSLLLLGGLGLIAYRAARHRRRRGAEPRLARLDGLACALSKFPQAIGQLAFLRGRLTGRAQPLIEYKGPASAA